MLFTISLASWSIKKAASAILTLIMPIRTRPFRNSKKETVEEELFSLLWGNHIFLMGILKYVLQ